jgi:bacteriorhodopsin
MYNEINLVISIIFSSVSILLENNEKYMESIINTIAAISYFYIIQEKENNILKYKYFDWLLLIPFIAFILYRQINNHIDKILIYLILDIFTAMTIYKLKKKDDKENKESKLVWFGISTSLIIPLLLFLFESTYTLELFISIVWLLYPVVILLNEFNIISYDISTYCFWILDFAGKGGLAFL